MHNFRKLVVWQNSIQLVKNIYPLTTKNENFKKDYGLKDQIQRASVSIASNIAEGEESGTKPLAIRYLNIAKGSAAEVLTQLIIAKELNYISENDLIILETEIEKITKMIISLIKYKK